MSTCIYFQLAANAGNPIAMTDDEKQRVEGLLADLNSLVDIPEDEATQVRFHKRIKYNWKCHILMPGHCFCINFLPFDK